MNQSTSHASRADALALARRLELLLDDLESDDEVDRYGVRVARGIARTLSDHLRALDAQK